MISYLYDTIKVVAGANIVVSMCGIIFAVFMVMSWNSLSQQLSGVVNYCMQSCNSYQPNDPDETLSLHLDTRATTPFKCAELSAL